MTVKIKDLPMSERPYERLIDNGVESLNNEELLAILIKSGTKNSSAKDIANQILKSIDNIGELKNYNYKVLSSIKGIGNKKSCSLLAAIELGKRVNNYQSTIINQKFNSAEIVYKYYKNKLCDKKQEYFFCIYLDNSKKIIKEKLLFIGTINYSIVHPREIFKEAYYCSASSILCIHNHPSDNILPSREDINLTQQLVKIGKLLDIKVIDHIIIGKNNYYSLLENNDI